MAEYDDSSHWSYGKLMQPYQRPPITEAIVEFRLQSSLDSDLMVKLSRAFAERYPAEESITGIHIHFGAPGELPPPPPPPGFKRSTLDAVNIVVLQPNFLAVAQLAPYEGWDAFFSRVKSDWKLWRQKTDFRHLSRLGVRYVNRIDVPTKEELISQDLYLNLVPRVPNDIGPLLAYSQNAVFKVEELGGTLTINTASVPSPLVHHVSFLLDIDIGCDEPPQREEDIFVLLDKMRAKKNKIFEACITDAARELFSK